MTARPNRTMGAGRLFLSVLLFIPLGCGHRADESEGSGARIREPEREPIQLEDVTEAVGLSFRHDNGMSGELYFVETVGSGGALADFDGDGDLDVLLVQGQLLAADAETIEQAGLRSRVFRNELIGPNGEPGELAFVDVTESSGLDAQGYGMGVATGDLDNDGRIDAYITNFGANQLWRNVSDAAGIRFENVTTRSGSDDLRWSTSASIADLDQDGWLDLFVTNYVGFRLENHKVCRTPGGRPNYCGPQSFAGESDSVFQNLGGFRFADRSASTGIADAPSTGLGVVTADLDRDGRLDVYVANDLEPNFLWRNLGGDALAFEDVALMSGSAVAMDGRAQASMGLLAGDVDNDGDDDLFMTHLRADTNTLYLNDGHGGFLDASSRSGLGGASLQATGFGTVFIDFDNDGWLDILAANGAVTIIEEQAAAGSEYPLAQPNQAFRNRGHGDFVEISERIGGSLTELEVSRGLAVGDVDNDGWHDVLLTNNNGPARLLLNRSETAKHWLGLRLLTEGGVRDALGAQAQITTSSGRRLWRRSATDGSYLSANDPRVLVGLGDESSPVDVEIRWPGGRVERWTGLEVDRYHVLSEAEGRPPVERGRVP